MNFWQAILLGAVQGFTEFFPVSSSGHLLLFSHYLGIDVDNNLFLSVLLHAGTLIAVIATMFPSIIKMFKRPRKLLYWVVATIPAGLVGIFLNDFVEQTLYRFEVLPITFMITAIILLGAEVYAKKTHHQTHRMHLYTAVAMGFAQAIAVIPGLSRSGMTISAGVVCKNDREEIAKFSFMMSIPVIAGSLLFEIISMVKTPADVTLLTGGTPWYSLVAAVIVATITGMFAIKVMLKTIRDSEFKWFSVYLFFLALAIIVIG